MRRVAERYARKEKAAKAGYHITDEAYYESATVAQLLPFVIASIIDGTVLEQAQEMIRDGQPKGSSSPAEGGNPYYQLGTAANTGPAANFTASVTGVIARFITDVGSPNHLVIPAGVWSIDVYLSETGGGSNHARRKHVLPLHRHRLARRN